MFQIGESLREARTRRGFTAADVHKAIRIRERYLTALEEERWDMLPGEAYTKGFLRTYADYLGLNGQLYVDEYNARVARHEDDAPPLVPQPVVERSRMRGRGVLVALGAVAIVGAAVAGLVAWQLGGSSSTPPARGSGSISVAVQTSTATTQATTTTQKKIVSTKPVFTSISATRGSCWVLVRAGGPHGVVVYQGTLEQGEVKTFHFTTRLWLRMGDPTNVDITLAGKPVTGLPTSPSNVVLTRAGALRQ